MGKWDLGKRPILPAEVERAKESLNIGDVVRVRTVLAVSNEHLSSIRTPFERSGVVVGKYPSFYVVEYPSGVRDSFLWVDLVIQRRGKIDDCDSGVD